MDQPSVDQLASLFQLLERKAPELRAGCRWVIFGPEVAAAILSDVTRPPEVDELHRLLRLLERKAPELVPVGFWIVDESEHAEAVRVDLHLDRLVAADIDAWHHPTQVLAKPRPDYGQLLAVCKERKKLARGRRRRHLSQVEEKLERAARIDSQARARREQMRRSRRYKKKSQAAIAASTDSKGRTNEDPDHRTGNGYRGPGRRTPVEVDPQRSAA